MNDKEKTFMSAVIYIHNAESRIENFLRRIVNVIENNFENSEIICVNDFSTDNSVEIITHFSKAVTNTTVTIINMSYFHGLETAMNAGVDLAIGDFVLEFDTTCMDFSEKEIMEVYRKALEGYDIVSMSPNVKQKISSNVFYFVLDHFTDFSHKIHTESFRILSRRVINRISSMNKSIPYRKAVYANCGLKTLNVKYEKILNGMAEGIDKKEMRYRRGLAIDTLLLFTDVGYRFSIIMTVLMMIITILMVVYSLIVYVMSNPVAGWTTTILFMSVAFFGLFGILTVIIKYLQIIVDLIFRRKKYSFESIQKLTK